METGKAIYKLLKDSTAVGDICGDRIYPELAQQDADLPFIVYTVTDTTPSATKNATSKLDTARVELYCISGDYEQAMDMGIAVRSALDRQSGTLSGVEVQSIDFDTSDVQFDPDQRVYVLEQTYDVRIQRTGTAQVVTQFPGNTFTVQEVDGDPSGAVNKLVFSNGTVTIDGTTATVVSGGGAAGDSYHGRYDTQAETLRSGATGNVEYYYTARPDGDGEAESITSDEGETDTINRTLAYSTKHRADPDTAADWTDYTTQPADNASFATAKAALLAGLNETDATEETRGTLPLSLKMTRTTTSAVTDLLLDTYTGAAAAYSVRKLDKDYTGNCLRVRRSSDEATQDIGFDSAGDLDTAAIATFCSGAYGYVTAWYDQSGNGNNATQSTTTAQPMIYDRIAAAVVTENSKPALDFNGAALKLGTFAQSQPFSVSFVYQSDETDSTLQNLYGSRSSANVFVFLRHKSSQFNVFTSGGNVLTGTVNNDQRLVFIVWDGTSSSASIDGVDSAISIGTNATENFTIGSRGNDSPPSVDRVIQELVLWPSDQGTNRTGIESDIIGYFSIYT